MVEAGGEMGFNPNIDINTEVVHHHIQIAIKTMKKKREKI